MGCQPAPARSPAAAPIGRSEARRHARRRRGTGWVCATQRMLSRACGSSPWASSQAQTPLHTPSRRPAAGTGVCPAVPSAPSRGPCAAQLRERMRQRDSRPSALVCRAGQAARLFCAAKTGLNLRISHCPVEGKDGCHEGGWYVSTPCSRGTHRTKGFLCRACWKKHRLEP